METLGSSGDTDYGSLRISLEEASREKAVAWDAQSVNDLAWVLREQRKE